MIDLDTLTEREKLRLSLIMINFTTTMRLVNIEVAIWEVQSFVWRNRHDRQYPEYSDAFIDFIANSLPSFDD